MANCIQCGRELPSFSVGEQSNLCSDCKRQLQAQPQAAAQGNVVRKPTLLETAREFPITAAIVGINLAIYVACAVMSVVTGMGSPMDFDTRLLLRFGADYGPLALGGEWWRLFTSMWLHGGLIHVAANMYGLWAFGRITERIYGRSRYLVIYLVTGIASSVASVAWHSEPTVSVGASGAIFGVVGALVWPFYRKRLRLPPAVMSSMLRNIGTVIVINLIIGASIPVIDNAAHVGGLIAGLILGAVFVELAVKGADHESTLWKVTAASAILLAAAFVAVRHARLPELLSRASLYAFRTGNQQLALERAQQAVKARPNDPLGHIVLGEVYLQQSKYADAAKEYAIAHQLDPEDADITARLGTAYASSGNWQAAEPVLRQAVKANPNNADALTDLGVTLAATNRVDEGLADIRKALQIDPKSARAQYALGTILSGQGKYQEALSPLREAVKLDPSDDDYRKALAAAEKATSGGSR
ncbi:MAG: rhomboid family intramembrane serine protease [Terriglobales bacterium]